MVTKLPRLHGLARLQFDTPPARVLRLRDTSFDEGRSTLEAIAEALGRLEGPAVSEPLLSLHTDYVERVLKARGVFEQKRDTFERTFWRPLE
jgi:DTW domain-containing protein YfiP